jgi:hypothetical protein
VTGDAPDGGVTGAAGSELSGHGGRRLVDDRSVPGRVFLVIGAGVGSLGVIYWATAYEEAGTVMLVVATILALWVAVYLWLRERHGEAGEAGDAADPGTAGGPAGPAAGHAVEQYLPHASVWPFAIGLGAAGIGVGLVLGLWVIVPGLGIMALGLGGFIRQTRRRD